MKLIYGAIATGSAQAPAATGGSTALSLPLEGIVRAVGTMNPASLRDFGYGLALMNASIVNHGETQVPHFEAVPSYSGTLHPIAGVPIHALVIPNGTSV